MLSSGMTRYHKSSPGEIEAGRNLSQENLLRSVDDDIGGGAVCCREPVESLVIGTHALAVTLSWETRLIW
jgi:hypothetical protein